jgi:NAD(P)-dependent dehydrogenase (short-subunit alcohol dehydrogenase family)
MSTGHATSQPGPGWALVKPPRLEKLPASAGRAVTNLQGAVTVTVTNLQGAVTVTVTNLQGAVTVTVVTGGAGGIGRALAERFAAEGARAVVVADLDGREAARVAAGLACPSPLGAGLDVTDQAAVAGLVDRVEEQLGPVDLWCSNAGVALGRDLGTDGDWERSFAVHVLAHVHLARVLAPRMAARGRGHLLLTASAAGLLTSMDSAPYSVTKHGTVALAEWLAIRWGDAGVGVSCLCPQGVRTAMTEGMGAGSSVLAAGALLEPAEVAEAVVGGLADGRFLILPHPEVAEFERRRAADRDRWLAGMRRARARLGG